MVKQLGPNCAEVTMAELGTNCWHPCRFIQDDGRCHRVWACSYPEKEQCQAVKAEICHTVEQQSRLLIVYTNLDLRIKELIEMLQK